MTKNLLHYTECGLKNVYLRNGYQRHDTPYGEAIAVHDVDGLHQAIGLHLVNDKPDLTGAEVCFLRKELDLPQAQLAQVLGVSENSVRAWENHRSKITKPAERILRAVYREHVSGDGSVTEMIERISRLNRDMYEQILEFEEGEDGWRSAAA